MNNVQRGEEFASAVLRYLVKAGMVLQPEYSIRVGLNSKSTKNHRFDLGSSDVLVECKCYSWTEGGNTPSAKIATLNEAMMYFHSTPSSYRKMLFLPKSTKVSAKNLETFAEYYVRLHGHFIPEAVEVWELDIRDGNVRKI